MKSIILPVLASAFAIATAAAVEIGKPAPAFSAKDAKGAAVSLADLKGKTVVLEWTNYDCPFVKKHYDSKNMQTLQSTYTGKDVVWITVNSAAAGKEGYVEPAKLAEAASAKGSKPSHMIADGDGAIGKAYAAKTTPHMFIINKEGTLVYDGAIDSKATTDTKDIDSADKLFANALDATLAGKEVANAKNKPYGCGVKY